MTEAIIVDTSSFSKFAKDLKRAEPKLAKGLRRNMLAAGQVVASDARRRADNFARKGPGTNRISKSIKVGVSGNRIRVYALAKTAPEAKPLEHGGIPGTFRHRVFQTTINPNTWTDQPARPFLHPALIAEAPVAVKMAKKAVDDALDEVHSHRG